MTKTQSGFLLDFRRRVTRLRSGLDTGNVFSATGKHPLLTPEEESGPMEAKEETDAWRDLADILSGLLPPRLLDFGSLGPPCMSCVPRVSMIVTETWKEGGESHLH